MKDDFKIFLRYVFNFKGFFNELIEGIKKPATISYICLAFALYFSIKLTRPKNIWVSAMLLTIALIMQLRVVYLNGEHRGWNRKRLGMKSKKEIKRMRMESLRKEWDAEKGEEDPKIEYGTKTE